MHFHHIAIATKDITASCKKYGELGFVATEVVYDSIQKVNICFLKKQDHPLIELVEPGDGNSPVNSVLEKNGTSIYHLCYEVDDIDETIAILRAQKFLLLGKPVPAAAIDERRICFLYNKNVGLIELVEAGKSR